MDKRLLYTLKNSVRLAEEKFQNMPTWAFLTEVMGIGKSRAYEVCHEFGFNSENKAIDEI